MTIIKRTKQSNKVVLTYTPDKYMEIKFHCSINKMFSSWMPTVTLHWKGRNYDIFEHDMMCFSRDLRDCFRALLINKRPLEVPLSEPNELGYLYNQRMEEKIPYDEWGHIDTCIARHADAKEPEEQEVAIWLYNDEQGHIVFYMGELYTDSLKKRGIRYSKFIKNYQPVAVEIIPHTIVRKWLMQSDYLEWQLQENERLWDIKHAQLKAAGKCKQCLEEAADE